MKKIVIGILFFYLTLFSFQNIVFASNKEVILGGDSIGLKFNTGVIVSGKYDVETINGVVKPWENSNIMVGDKIIMVGNVKINTIDNLLSCLNILKNESLNLTLLRDNKIINTEVDVIRTINNEKTVGLYIKDSIVGIGTLTYIDSETSTFASLGHGIKDKEVKMECSGTLLKSNVKSIKKGTIGVPGEKRATISKNTIGSILSNTNTGVYGVVKDLTYFKNRQKIKLSTVSQAKLGSAKLYTVINDNIIKCFDVKVIDVNYQTKKDIKGIKIQITDKTLIEECGGIIQGMSGSPIVQDGYLIGAVSHVVVDNPEIGYAVHVSFMDEDRSIIEDALIM